MAAPNKINLNDLKSHDTTPTPVTKPVPVEKKTSKPLVLVKKVDTIQELPQSRRRWKSYIFAFLLLVVCSGIIGGIYYFDIKRTTNLFLETYDAELTQEEKASGVLRHSFVFYQDRYTESFELQIKGIKQIAEVSTNTKLQEQKKDSVIFNFTGRKIDSLDITIPSNLCSENPADCETQKANIEKDFRNAITEQQSKLEKSTITLSKINDSKIQFDSSVEGKRVLVKR
jgi:hypothetical protein